ncbi:MAG TPA: alpha-amylase family glycosyl hydrolase [Candidatus Dormibacteraeota bacterium]|nr:alpha-amylase family glycosyl hydrolase [Candidatus Dormibacteraeota bacterium]
MPIVARGRSRRLAGHRPVARVLALIAGAGLMFGACSPTVAPTGGPVAVAPSGPASPSAAVTACIAATPASALRPWWDTAVFYEVFVRSFADSNGDGIGDLAGLTAHLDELNDGNPATTGDLGVTALWLMPVAESPSYHGYDVTDYTKIEPDYGDAAAFHALVDAAHKRGIKVIVDFEANHTSDQHPWFVDALAGGPHHDWYVWSKTDQAWPNPIGGGNPWHPSPAGYYYGVFSAQMPDLNLRNPAVTAELERIAGVWVNTMGVDGFRIDAARHLIEDGPTTQVNTPETHAWLAAFSDAVHTDGAHQLVLGEVNDAELRSAGYVKDGSLDMAFDFEIGPEIGNAVAHGDAGSLLYAESGVQRAYTSGGAGTFLSNHDQPRIMTQLRDDTSAAAESAATLLTGPGTPFIYYGEELGMVGDKPDEQIRTPYPWTATGPGHGFTTGTPWEPFAPGADVANLATESADPASLLSTYRDLIRLREAHPALATGPLVQVDASDPHVAASLRVETNGERLLVIQNLGQDRVADVSLSLQTGPLCTPVDAAVALYPASLAAPTAAAIPAPTLNAAGGFDAYRPLAILPGRSTIVLSLNP